MNHAFLSCSGSKRWINCPGSAHANADRPREESDASLEGTTAHALLEVCLRMECEPDGFMGVRLGPGLMLIDEKMITGVGYVLDYVRAYLLEHPDAKLYTEHTVHAGPVVGVGEDVCWGTSDVIIDNYPTECVVLDYKHGEWRVDAKDNSQLGLYHAGQRYARGRYRRYRNVIVQPNARGTKPVREHTLTDKQLMAWLDSVVRPAAHLALKEDAPRKAGEWCKFCYASGRCKAQADKANTIASVEFRSRDQADLSPQERAKLLSELPTLKIFMEDFLAASLEMLQKGEAIPGYQLGYNPARRIWVDADKADTLLRSLGLGIEQRKPRELLSPTKAEKALRQKKLWRAPKGQHMFGELLGYTDRTPCIEKAPSGTEPTDNEGS